MKEIRLNMNEETKFNAIKDLVENNGNKKRVAIKLNLSIRQINRLIKVYKEKGKSGFVHGNKGHSPVNRTAKDITTNIIELYNTKYKGFNFSHFKDMLEQNENIKVSYGTLYKILNKSNILSPKMRKETRRRKIKEAILKNKPNIKEEDLKNEISHEISIESSHPRKQRPKYFGEVVQMDGSNHLWFGDFKTTLHLSVDYSTGTILGGFFDKEETLYGYYTVMKQILLNYGIPGSFLTDNRTVFNYMKDNFKKDHKDVLTQFGYACKTLGITLNTSSVSQSKGLIERDNGTFQDRLVNELKLRNIKDIDSANKYLIEKFIPNFNEKFATKHRESDSVMEKSPDEDKIDLILSVLSPRKFDTGSALKYENKYYQAYDSNNNLICFLNKTECLVIKSYKGELFVTVDDKVYKLVEYIKNKDNSLEYDNIKEDKTKKTHYIPPMTHPWKRTSFAKQQERAHKLHLYT